MYEKCIIHTKCFSSRFQKRVLYEVNNETRNLLDREEFLKVLFPFNVSEKQQNCYLLPPTLLHLIVFVSFHFLFSHLLLLALFRNFNCFSFTDCRLTGQLSNVVSNKWKGSRFCSFEWNWCLKKETRLSDISELEVYETLRRQ